MLWLHDCAWLWKSSRCNWIPTKTMVLVVGLRCSIWRIQLSASWLNSSISVTTTEDKDSNPTWAGETALNIATSLKTVILKGTLRAKSRHFIYNSVYFYQLLTLNFKRVGVNVFHWQLLQPSIKQRDIEVFLATLSYQLRSTVIQCSWIQTCPFILFFAFLSALNFSSV